jgi:hypothetical protein
MTTKTNCMPSWACALSTFVLAGTADAQVAAPGWYPQQYPAHISVQAAPSTQLEVVPVGAPVGTPAVAQCTGYCDFWAWPGKYTLYARDPSTGQRKELSLRFKSSSRFTLEPGDDQASTAGLALGIAGSAAAITGVLWMLSADAEQYAATPGIVVFFAGAAATPLGFIIYGNNRTRLSRFDEPSYPAIKGPGQVRVGVVGVGLGGFGLGGVATF